MLSKLRWKLTVYYFLIALFLIALVGGGSYFLLTQYFQQTTDLALQYRMAQELTRYGVTLPSEMITAADRWCEMNQLPTLSVNPEGQTVQMFAGDEEDEQKDDDYLREDAFNPDLATIFVFPLDRQGNLLFNPNQVSPNFTPDVAAVDEAIRTGCDWRTVKNIDGKYLRLFTYTLPQGMAPAVIQLGRFVDNQQQTLMRLMTGILLLAAVSVLLLGLGAWLLAGRSLKPAQDAWERQQTFIANASHELRTPLTIMRASSEVALRRATDERQKQLLFEVLAENDYMAHLVEDLLILSRFDAGQILLNKSEISISETISEAVEKITPFAQQHGVEISTMLENLTVSLDPIRFRQVLLILLNNAIAHSPTRSAISINSYSAGNLIVIEVQDHGEGISPKHLPRLFDRFYQVDSSRGKNLHGAGLGLSIAKNIVEAHHGTISITSEVGKGTLVTLKFPK